MSRKTYTEEEYLYILKEVHGDKYDYSKFKYVDSRTKTLVGCRIHGFYETTPSNHRQGYGCKKCATEYIISLKRSDTKSFVKKMLEVHKDAAYNYDITEYKGNNNTKVAIECLLHGVFEATPANLLSGKGCPQCGINKRTMALRSNTKSFIEKSKLLFGEDFFLYDNVDYITNFKKVSITCKTHGDFLTQPSNHLMGNGCPKCQKNGFSKGRSGTFYILTSDNITKVGITNRDVKVRLHEINRNNANDFKVNSALFFEDGSIPYKIEQQTLKYLSSKYKSVSEVFDGSTECFLDVDLVSLINFVTPLAVQITELQSSLTA